MDDALAALALHHCILSIKAELDQLCEGLKCMGVLEVIRQNTDIFLPYFLASGNTTLTAGSPSAITFEMHSNTLPLSFRLYY